MGNGVAPHRIKAIVVGIERYDEGPEWDLNGPLNDACRFIKFLSKIDVPRSNIRAYVNSIDVSRPNTRTYVGPLVRSVNKVGEDKEIVWGEIKKLSAVVGEPTEATFNALIQDTLPKELCDVLLIYWSGHGFMASDSQRRLFFSDATSSMKKNLNLNNLLHALGSDTFPNIGRVDAVIDACANYVAATTAGVTDHVFPVGQRSAEQELRVLCAASAGEYARNLNAEQTGLFTRELMTLLEREASARPGYPELQLLAKPLRKLFQAQQHSHAPTLIWSAGPEEEATADVPANEKGDLFLGRLGVFERSFSFLGCTAIYPDFRTLEVEAQLQRLIDASLLKHHSTLPRRFLLSPRAHRAARERLKHLGDAANIRKLHACFYRKTVEQHEPFLRHSARQGSLDLLAEESSNLDAALKFCKETPDLVEEGLKMGGALFWYWNFMGLFQVGRRVLEELLKAPAPEHDTDGRARALYAAGALAFMEGKFATARTRLEQSRQYWECQASNPERDSRLGYTLVVLGRVQPDFDQAIRDELRAIELFKRISDPFGHALALNDLGYVQASQRDWLSARNNFTGSLSLWREQGDRWGEALTLNNLGMADLQLNESLAARRHHERALRINFEEAHSWGIAESLKYLGEVAVARGDFTEAGGYFRESLRRLALVQRKQLAVDCLLGLARLAAEANSPEFDAKLATRRLAVWINETKKHKLISPPHHAQLAVELKRQLEGALGTDFEVEWDQGTDLRVEDVIAGP